MAEQKSVVTKKQPSLSEWFRAIKHVDAEKLQREDVRKRDRLEVLRKKIGIDYDRVTSFPATDFYARTREVADFISAHGDDLCALRLVPHDATMPKLRTRGQTLIESLPWLREHDVELDQYVVEFVEHSDTAKWSTIFVVRDDAIFGELVPGLHFQLTQGNTDNGSYAFVRTKEGVWSWTRHDKEVEAHMADILQSLLVSDLSMRSELKAELNSTFTDEGYIKGYFETLLWPKGLVFIDYNRLLHHYLEPPMISLEDVLETGIKGTPAARGEARGRVSVVQVDSLDDLEFNDGDILVTDNTDVTYLPLMRRAGAIVTDRGGMLSHAAITSRELGVPCVVGCKDATTKLKTGDMVFVDATNGIISIL
ncbi:MAG: PEP-utilizing enzyme [bacterium]|nr:PEP-utilizing enzyme [bacterium]